MVTLMLAHSAGRWYPRQWLILLLGLFLLRGLFTLDYLVGDMASAWRSTIRDRFH